MATTRIIPMHIAKGRSVAYTVHGRLDYAMNPAKRFSKFRRALCDIR